jgi:hypothetical protein
MHKLLFTCLIYFPQWNQSRSNPTEMTLIVDVDINLLKELHEHGSVNTMKDRRHDLYSLKQMK